VAFRALDNGARLVKVSAPGRRLGGTAGDERIVEQIAVSTVRHFTCRDGEQARVRSGSARMRDGVWHMVIMCR
jgi:hypothetical protein